MLWGEVLEAEPYTRLVYSFMHHGHVDGQTGRVEWVLEELAAGTKLTLTHTSTAPSEETVWNETKGVDSGWDEHLFRLRSALS